MTSDAVWSLTNPVLRSYLFYSCILAVKVILMAPLTARIRFKKKIFISPEDIRLRPDGNTNKDDPDIERVRRAHLNDLENIPYFFVAAFAYVLTDPPAWAAFNLFRVYTLSRLVHTFVYAIVVVPQPARGIAWFFGFAITIFMAIYSLVYFFDP